LGEDLHFLKGSALSLGFSRFSELCHRGEIAAETGLAENIDLDAITDTFTVSKQSFFQGLPRLNAA
jgi:HPt (histidine-containing phosphotransfer) domain-containing protein